MIRPLPAATVLLKDPEGYLYQTNVKKKSGKLYWHCKTHRKLGCRVNATTKGFTLESITGWHDHDHTPPPHGNNKKMLNHQRKDIETRVLNVEATFVTSSKGGPVLKDPEGFLYLRNRRTEKE